MDEVVANKVVKVEVVRRIEGRGCERVVLEEIRIGWSASWALQEVHACM